VFAKERQIDGEKKIFTSSITIKISRSCDMNFGQIKQSQNADNRWQV